MSKLISWDNVMDQSLKLPGMKVNRTIFLTEVLKQYGDISNLENKRPIDIIDEYTIEKIANDIITKHLRITSATSTVAGIPGGLAMFGTVPADMAQFYGHVLVSAQKLGYLYGWPDLLDENNNVTEGTRNILTLFVGVMFGAGTANKAITEIGKNTAMQVAKRLPQKALTKTAYYPVIKEVGKWIGLKITKDVFSKGISKVIPVLGGIVSGGITYVSFNTMSKKLHNHLKTEMRFQQPWTSNLNEFTDCEYTTNSTCDTKDLNTFENEVFESLELTKLKCCINIAKIDFNLDDSEIELLTALIDDSTITDNEKMDLLLSLRNKDLFEIHLGHLKNHELHSISLLENLATIVNADSVIKISEKIYFYKIANELGFSKDQVLEFLE